MASKEHIKRFSDFAKEPETLEGDKVKIDDIINREIVVCAYSLKGSKYSKNESGKYLTIQFYMPDNSTKRIFFTGSDVLINQIEKYKEHIPFCAVVKRINKYYTFS